MERYLTGAKGAAWPLTILSILVLVVLSLVPVHSLAGAASTPEKGSPVVSGGAAGGAADVDDQIVQARGRLKENRVAQNQLALGQLLLRKGVLDEAMQAFDQALKLNARSHEAKTGRGIVLARKGNLKEAESVLQEALVQNPNPVRTHYELGVLYQQMGEFEKAAAHFKEGIQKKEQGRR